MPVLFSTDRLVVRSDPTECDVRAYISSSVKIVTRAAGCVVIRFPFSRFAVLFWFSSPSYSPPNGFVIADSIDSFGHGLDGSARLVDRGRPEDRIYGTVRRDGRSEWILPLVDREDGVGRAKAISP